MFNIRQYLVSMVVFGLALQLLCFAAPFDNAQCGIKMIHRRHLSHDASMTLPVPTGDTKVIVTFGPHLY